MPARLQLIKRRYHDWPATLSKWDVLYKRSYLNVLLRCVDTKEANEITWEVHGRACGP